MVCIRRIDGWGDAIGDRGGKHGQGDGEATAQANSWRHGADLAAMQFHEILDQRKPQAQTTLRTVRVPFSLEKRSNMCGINACSMPMPLSMTEISTVLSSAWTSTEIVPNSLVYFDALPSRLATT